MRLSRSIYPAAKIFSITTGTAVMKLNHEFGFRPVAYAEITRDGRFWDKCRGCVNYPILQSQGRQRCLCTAMLWEPKGYQIERAIFKSERKGQRVTGHA
jgi:hypothetical protein